MNYVVPLVILFFIIVGFVKKVNVYDSFTLGVKEAVPLAVGVFPYVFAMLLMVGLLRESGVFAVVEKVFSPLLSFFGVPSELTEYVLLRPFSGSGSLALLQNVFDTYGADSYVGRCASTVAGSSETVFYVFAVYFSGTRIKKYGPALFIALFCSFCGVILSCLLCKLM